MTKIVLSISLFLMVLFIGESSPLVLAILLTAVASCFGLVAASTCSKWVGFAIILIFVGGMMISFLYVSSLSANAKMQIPMETVLLIFLISAFFSYLGIGDLTAPPQTPSPASLYSSWNSVGLLYLVSYLLLALLVAVKLTEGLKGALVKKF